jgi:hypothetical protein
MRNSQNHDLLQLREIFEDFAVEIPKYVSDPVDVDIGRFVTTSRLITDFPPLLVRNRSLPKARSSSAKNRKEP